MHYFKVAFSPVTPAIGFLLCLWMMGSFDMITRKYVGGWMAAGLVLYFAYGMRRSQLAREDHAELPAREEARPRRSVNRPSCD